MQAPVSKEDKARLQADKKRKAYSMNQKYWTRQCATLAWLRCTKKQQHNKGGKGRDRHRQGRVIFLFFLRQNSQQFQWDSPSVTAGDYIHSLHMPSNSEVIHKTVASVEMRFTDISSFVVKDLHLKEFHTKIFHLLSQKHILHSLCPKHIYLGGNIQACYP